MKSFGIGYRSVDMRHIWSFRQQESLSNVGPKFPKLIAAAATTTTTTTRILHCIDIPAVSTKHTLQVELGPY